VRKRQGVDNEIQPTVGLILANEEMEKLYD